MLSLLTASALAAKPPKPVGVIRRTRVKADWDIDYSWSVGVRSGAAVTFGSSATSWKVGPELGLIFEKPLVNTVSLLLDVEHARHHLRNGDKYLQDGPVGSGDALDGYARHTLPRAGIRWFPPATTRPENRAVEPHAFLSFHLGADIVTTALELPAVDGRTRITTTGGHPMLAAGGGLLLEVGDTVDLALGLTPAVLFTFDPAEVGGSDRLGVTGRLGSSLDVLGRF